MCPSAEKAADDKIIRLEDIAKAQAERIRSLESPFVTPVKSSFAASPPCEATQPATMPVPEGGLFSAGVRVRGDRDKFRGRMWLLVPELEGGKGANLEFLPYVAGAPCGQQEAPPGAGGATSGAGRHAGCQGDAQ
jgi:hypothetical protein